MILLLLLIPFLILVVFVVMYNGLVLKRNAVDNAFACVDTQLKRRSDLVPNLAESVKGYMKHEASTLTEIAALRSKAVAGPERAAIDDKIGGALKSLLVNVESYPDLKASENFQQLQRSLNEIEEQLAAARRAFNAAVTEYNNGIQVFPTSVVAGLCGFSKREVFAISEAERANPDLGKIFKS